MSKYNKTISFRFALISQHIRDEIEAILRAEEKQAERADRNKPKGRTKTR